MKNVLMMLSIASMILVTTIIYPASMTPDEKEAATEPKSEFYLPAGWSKSSTEISKRRGPSQHGTALFRDTSMRVIPPSPNVPPPFIDPEIHAIYEGQYHSPGEPETGFVTENLGEDDRIIRKTTAEQRRILAEEWEEARKQKNKTLRARISEVSPPSSPARPGTPSRSSPLLGTILEEEE